MKKQRPHPDPLQRRGSHQLVGMEPLPPPSPKGREPSAACGRGMNPVPTSGKTYALVPLELCSRTSEAMLTDIWSIAFGLLELCSRVPKPLLFHAESMS